ncbi:MAG: terminase family protein [Verrucomicrobiota bacterium]
MKLPFDNALAGSLLPYQRRWANDNSRWKYGLMSRQVGKDHASAYEGIREIVAAEKAGRARHWLIAAPSERQSLESLRKWKDWAKAFNKTIAAYEERREGKSESLLQSATITFPGGSRVVAVPGKPDTVRGFSANVLLTEFAFFEQPDATWRAILPSITNPLNGGIKKVRLITTPNGIGNKANELWVKHYNQSPHLSHSSRNPNPPQNNPWSCHLVDIHQAVAEGLAVVIEELRQALDDPLGWAQEYECNFLDTQNILLPYDLIASCESIEASTSQPPDFWTQRRRPSSTLVMGIDFGRRHNLTVAWTNSKLGDVANTVEVLELDNMSTPDQLEILRHRLAAVQKVCFDYTGPGVGMGDFLVKQFGEWNPAHHRFGKIELCTFTNSLKVDIFSKLRISFERRQLRIPICRIIREDLHSVNRSSGSNGQISYRAPHNNDGHADRCSALALAIRAGESSIIPTASARIKIHRPSATGEFGEVSNDSWP